MAFGKCKTDLQQILLISANFDSPLNFHSDGSWLEMQIISTDPFDGSMDQAISDTDLPVTASNGNWQFSKLELAWNYSYQARIRVHQPDENGDDQVSDWTDWQTGQVAAQAPDPLTIAATHNSDGSTTITWDTSDTSNSNNFVSFLDEDQVWAWDAAPYSAGTYTYTPGNADGPNLQGQVTAVVVAPDPSGASVYPIGVSDYSNLITLPGDAPAGPQNLSATPYSGGVRLLWDNDSDNETGFTIQRSTSADFSTDLQTFTVAADVTSYVDNTGTDDTSVQPGTTYYYQVEANGSDETASAFSNTANAVVTLPTVSVTALDPNANADGPDGNPQDGYLDFHRTGDLASALTASVSYTGTTADSGGDYSGTLPTTATFPAGQQDVVVPVVPANGTAGVASVVDAQISAGTGYNANDDTAEVNVAMHGMSITLDGGAADDILDESANGQENLQPLAFTVPADAPTGTEFTLSIATSRDANAANLVDVWTPIDVGNSAATPLFGDGSDSCSWTVGQSGSTEPPTTLDVGAIAGSSTFSDLIFKVAEITAAGAASALSNPGTAEGLTATYNGIPLVDVGSGTEGTVPVGALISLKATYNGPGNPAAKIGWGIEGDTLSAYNLNVGVQKGPVPASTSSASGASNEVAWATPGDETVEAEATVGGQTFSLFSQLSVVAPTVTLDVADHGVQFDPDTYSLGLITPVGAKGGIEFTGAVTDPVGLPLNDSGQWEFVQTITEGRYRTDVNGNKEVANRQGVTSIDGAPYFVKYTDPLTQRPLDTAPPWNADGAAHLTSDANAIAGVDPVSNIGMQDIRANETLSMYLFYRAGGAYAGVWVPVKVVNWYWKGEAKKRGQFGRLQAVPGSMGSNDTIGDFPEFPTWTGNSQPLGWVAAPQ